MRLATLPSRKVEASDLADCTDSCPVCLYRGERRRVLPLQDSPSVYYLECPRCRACSASHIPSEEFLARFYSSFYDGKKEHVTFDGPERFGAHLVRCLPAVPRMEGIRILDFGGGDGRLAAAVGARLLSDGRCHQVEVTVVDPHVDELAATAGVPMRRAGELDEGLGQFDLVLASGVLEHMPPFHEVMKRLASAVSPGGCFYARTPWNIPLARILPRGDLSFPAHVHDLGAPFWNQVAETLQLPLRLIRSRPAIRQVGFREAPLRALLAAGLKLPGHLESSISPANRRNRFYRLVGGWEVLLQRAAASGG